jgi:hypothetical protein
MDKLSEKTILLYENNIERLDREQIDYKNINKIDDFVNILQKKSTNENTIRIYLCSVLYYYKKYNLQNEIITLLTKKISELAKKDHEKYDENVMSEKEKECYLDWNEIVSIFEKLYSFRNCSHTAFKKCITIGVYVLFPPRRIQDYCYMKIVKNNLDVNETENFYVMNEKMFIFSRYKNAKIYGTQKFNIDQRLSDLLDEYINKYNLVNKELIPLSESDLSTKIKRIFYGMSGKGATVNTLRHSFINYMTSNNMIDTTHDRKILASQMGHSHHMQQDLYRKIDAIY